MTRPYASFHVRHGSAITVPVADVEDEAQFPNISAARRWLDSLSPERRAEINADWSK